MARAIYSQKDIVFIDDVLRGLDWRTEECVWNRVFGPNGLLRQHGTTVILATHAGMTSIRDIVMISKIFFVVRHIRVADNIVVMGADNTVIEQGTFNQLNLQDGYVQSLLLEQQEYKNSVDATKPSVSQLS